MWIMIRMTLEEHYPVRYHTLSASLVSQYPLGVTVLQPSPIISVILSSFSSISLLLLFAPSSGIQYLKQGSLIKFLSPVLPGHFVESCTKCSAVL